MARRLVSLLGVACAGGCWAEEPLVHGAFTDAQWAHLQKEFEPPVREAPCGNLPTGAHDLPIASCDAAARLGQMLFFEPTLSGPGQTSCATCHDPAPAGDTGWYIDVRPNSGLSQGAQTTTRHNTMTLVNVHVGKRDLYAWTGECVDRSCRTASDVILKIAIPGAMASGPQIVGLAIRNNADYAVAYHRAFGDSAPTDDASIESNVVLALDLYLRRLNSLDAPFDAFIRGDDTAISESAKRGFALFVGKAMCIECHRGGMFSDNTFRVTGVADGKLDDGRDGTGAFHTASLRNIAETAPYMHNGSIATLADVIWFYSRGGGTTTFDKDPLMQPFELGDDEAMDLEGFLRSLTGTNIMPALRQDIRPGLTP